MENLLAGRKYQAKFEAILFTSLEQILYIGSEAFSVEDVPPFWKKDEDI